jgi:hypothetical protein
LGSEYCSRQTVFFSIKGNLFWFHGLTCSLMAECWAKAFLHCDCKGLNSFLSSGWLVC